MAKKQILSGLFADVIKDGNRLKKTLATVKDELSEISKIEKSKLVEIDEKTLQGLKSLEDSLKKLMKLKEASQETVKTEKKLLDEEEKVRRKLKDTTEEELKVRLRQSKILQEQKQRLKAVVDLERAEANSINELRAKVRILTQERNNLNLETAEGQKRLQELNTELDDHNQKIKENVDAMTKQRMNVGNYREDIEKAIGELTQGNAVLGVFVQGWDKFNSALESSKDIFANLQAEFKLVRAGLMANTSVVQANTVATTVNTTATTVNAETTALNTVATAVNTESTTVNTVATAINTDSTVANTVATTVNTESTTVNTTATMVNTSWLRRHFVAVSMNTKAIWRMVTSTKALKIALASTGIGLLIVALTGLVGMFSQGISGSLRFEKVMKGLMSGISTFVASATGVMSGFFTVVGSGFSMFFNNFKIMYLEFKNLINETTENTKELNDLKAQQVQNAIEIAEGVDKMSKSFANFGNIGKNSMKASEGAIIALKRRLETLRIDVTLAKLNKDFALFSEVAEDDTHSFGTRMSAYAIAQAKYTEILTQQMKKNIVEYQSGLGDITKRFTENAEKLTDTQKQLYIEAQKLMKVDITGMNAEQLSKTNKQYETFVKTLTKYVATASNLDLEDNFDAIDESEVKNLVDTYTQALDTQKEYNSNVIKNNEYKRKALQDQYEAEADLRETFVLRLKDQYTQIANDENKTYEQRLDALHRFVYASEKAISDNVASINELFKNLYDSQVEEDAFLGITTSAKQLTTEVRKVGNELKLFVNGVELNKDVFQGEFLKKLTQENPEKNVLFLRPLADLITDINMGTIELKKANYDLAKSYDDLNNEINATNKTLKAQEEFTRTTINLNNELLENNNLLFMSERDLMLFREKQSIILAEQTKKQAEKDLQIARNKVGLMEKQLQNLKEYLEYENQLRKESLQNQIMIETDPKIKASLEEQLKVYENFRVENVESYKEAEKSLKDARTEELKALETYSNSSVDYLNAQREQEMRILKERADMLQDIASGIDKFEQMMFDRKMKRLDREYERSKNHEARLIEAKKMGSEQANESLALEIAKQEKILLKKEKLERRKQRTELVTAGLKAYATNLEKGVTNPLSKTFTDTVALAQFLKEIPLFWEGAENVGDKLGKPHLNDKRDNYLVRVDGGERVMTNDQNAKLGNISNDELAEIGNKWNSGLLMDMTKLNFTPSKAILQPNLLVQNQMNEALLKDIKDELKSLPGKMPVSSFEYDEVNKMTIDILKKGNNVYKTRSRIR